MASKDQIKTLRSSICSDQPPHCSGVLTPAPNHFYLYYGEDKPVFIDLANASTESLVALTEACDPATFGLGGEDVLDETYRKAAKLDVSKFTITFDPLRCGLIGFVKDQLQEYNIIKTPLDRELSKLNVYGKDAFFKAHKDTPRSENMIGSLVVVFPTPHSGGELVLRNNNKEWTFDGASLVSSQSPPSVAYTTFYSDVEHEVLKVTSGHRVTITYNLYLLPSPTETQEPSAPITRNVTGLTNFKETLKTMLRDKSFLPKGGILGFGLAYQYPVSYKTKIEDLKDRLKGGDAHIWNVCSDLGLNPKIWITYGSSEVGTNSSRIRRGFGYKANVVNGVNARQGQIDGHYSGGSDKAMEVVWIINLCPASTLERPVMAYGNEAEPEFVYCGPCLVACYGKTCEAT